METESDTERLMLWSCRNTAKHLEIVCDTWDRSETSLSMRIPRSWTVVEGKAAGGSLRHEQQQMADGSADVWSNTRGSLSLQCSAVSDLAASSQTSLRPCWRLNEAGKHTQYDKSRVSGYRWHTGEGRNQVPRRDRSSRQCITWTVGGPGQKPAALWTCMMIFGVDRLEQRRTHCTWPICPHLTLLRRFCDSGAGYRTETYLLTYLLTFLRTYYPFSYFSSPPQGNPRSI